MQSPFSSANSGFTHSACMYTSCHSMKLVSWPALHLDQSWAWSASLPQGTPETGQAAFCSMWALGHPESPYSSSGPYNCSGISNSVLFVLVQEIYISLQPIFYLIQRLWLHGFLWGCIFFHLKFIVINRIKPKKNCHGLSGTRC